MRFILEKNFEDYIRSGNETTAELLASASPLVGALTEFYEFFKSVLWAGEQDMSANQAFLSLHSFMIYSSAMRMALTGHEAATFPLYRTALESACYALLMSKDKTLEAAWINRHQSDQTRRLCRTKFASAVPDAARLVDELEGHRGHAAWINDSYQLAIDFGAHPNPRAIYSHVQSPKEAGDSFVVAIAGLYGSESDEVIRSLFACLDYGQVIAVVMAHGLNTPHDEISDQICRLNDLKERLATEMSQREPGRRH